MKKIIVNIPGSIVYWCLICIPFSVAVAPAFSSAFVSFLFTFYFAKKFINKEKLAVKTSINTPYLIFFFISLVSIYNSIDYSSSVRGIFKLIEACLLYLIFVDEIKDKEQIKKIVFSLLGGLCLASINSIWQVFTGYDFIRHHALINNIGLMRATGPFPNANVLGVYLAPLTVIAFGLARYNSRGIKKAILTLILLISLTALIFTFSRPAALGVVVSIALMAIFKKDRLVIAILAIILLGAPFIAPKNIKNWAKEVKYSPLILMCNYDRISIYRNSLNMIKHNPIIGVGLNTFSKNYLAYKLPEAPNGKTGDTIYAHNNFLHMAGEIGILGLLAFLWLLWRLFAACKNIYRRLDEADLKNLAFCLAAGMIAFLINGLTETNLYYQRVSVMFWYLAGFALSLNKFTKR